MALSSDLPQLYHGRLFTFPVSLNLSYFDHCPGHNDLVTDGSNDYVLTIPDVVIGVRYGSSAPSDLQGNVYYTSGYSHSLQISHDVPTYLHPKHAIILSPLEEQEVRAFAANAQNRLVNLRNYVAARIYNSSISFDNYTISLSSDSAQRLLYNVSSRIDQFPVSRQQQFLPDLATLSLLVAFSADTATSYGNLVVSEAAVVNYTDSFSKAKSSSLAAPAARYASTRGALLFLNFLARLESGSLVPLQDQSLYLGSNPIVSLVLQAINLGIMMILACILFLLSVNACCRYAVVISVSFSFYISMLSS